MQKVNTMQSIIPYSSPIRPEIMGMDENTKITNMLAIKRLINIGVNGLFSVIYL